MASTAVALKSSLYSAMGRAESKRLAGCVMGAGCALALCILGGCKNDPYRPPAESILDYLAGPSPLYAAQLATDAYDADKRYRGTLLLAGASFAKEEVYLELFRAYTKDEDSAVRGAAARALANLGTADDATHLIALLNDEDPIVRREAARGLQRLHNAAAVTPLIAKITPQGEAGLLLEEDAQVRAEAAVALGQYATPAVVEALITSLDDPQLAVNRGSLSSLRTLTGQDLGYSRTAWTLWLREQTAPLQGQSVFIFPGYQRPALWIEYIPFVPKAPYEPSGVPTGYPLPGKT